MAGCFDYIKQEIIHFKFKNKLLDETYITKYYDKIISYLSNLNINKILTEKHKINIENVILFCKDILDIDDKILEFLLNNSNSKFLIEYILNEANLGIDIIQSLIISRGKEILSEEAILCIFNKYNLFSILINYKLIDKTFIDNNINDEIFDEIISSNTELKENEYLISILNENFIRKIISIENYNKVLLQNKNLSSTFLEEMIDTYVMKQEDIVHIKISLTQIFMINKNISPDILLKYYDNINWLDILNINKDIITKEFLDRVYVEKKNKDYYHILFPKDFFNDDFIM